MADYRGGDNNLSPQAAMAIKNIQDGNTPRQRRRELERKVLMSLISAAGVAGTAAGHAVYREGQEKDRKTGIMKDAIAKAAASRATQTRAPKDEYQDGGSSVMLGSLAESQNRELMDRAVKNGVESAKAKMDTNEVASMAPVGPNNYMTGPGMAKAAEDATLMGADINTSKRGMMAGGLQGSQPDLTLNPRLRSIR